MKPDDGVTSIGEEFPKEQARVREVLASYKAIGPPGAFGAAMIEIILREADQAMASGDLVAMLKAFHKMRGVEE